ncbi:hypothetical protein G7K_2171-t1 [Saitoella complicata NRRL Y-17804]|uniref:Uncharacterized protein n=2 Tax=Saitoella complicata (strain BCRC 22490 / CBS 7301 / JCM 7358 / NBRC 10748 / NRRL Y-17804) TaxID=698492 RepID=A0A0E9NF02_SAICN|nr:hypothetical protein G7K_2171-t1 [Saitoella complicata NRRL Y-17804]
MQRIKQSIDTNRIRDCVRLSVNEYDRDIYVRFRFRNQFVHGRSFPTSTGPAVKVALLLDNCQLYPTYLAEDLWPGLSAPRYISFLPRTHNLSRMSTKAKITFFTTVSVTAGVVYGVHWLQKMEQGQMHAGVLRDAERMRVRKERELELIAQQELQKQYEKVQTVTRDESKS